MTLSTSSLSITGKQNAAWSPSTQLAESHWIAQKFNRLCQLGFGFVYGLILTAVNLVATGIFLFIIDRGRTISGAYGKRHEVAVEDWKDPPTYDLTRREGTKV